MVAAIKQLQLRRRHLGKVSRPVGDPVPEVIYDNASGCRWQRVPHPCVQFVHLCARGRFEVGYDVQLVGGEAELPSSSGAQRSGAENYAEVAGIFR